MSINEPRPPPGSNPVTVVTMSLRDWNIAHTAAAITDPPRTRHIVKITNAAGKKTRDPNAIDADGVPA